MVSLYPNMGLMGHCISYVGDFQTGWPYGVSRSQCGVSTLSCLPQSVTQPESTGDPNNMTLLAEEARRLAER